MRTVLVQHTPVLPGESGRGEGLSLVTALGAGVLSQEVEVCPSCPLPCALSLCCCVAFLAGLPPVDPVSFPFHFHSVSLFFVFESFWGPARVLPKCKGQSEMRHAFLTSQPHHQDRDQTVVANSASARFSRTLALLLREMLSSLRSSGL